MAAGIQILFINGDEYVDGQAIIYVTWGTPIYIASQLKYKHFLAAARDANLLEAGLKQATFL